jgi:hypothetical protein
MKVLTKRNGFSTYGVPTPPVEQAPPYVWSPVESNHCKRVCYRRPIDVDVDDGGVPKLINGDTYWVCEWECVGDDLNPYKIMADAFEGLAVGVQMQTAELTSWITEELLPAIQFINIVPTKENWEWFITNLVGNIGGWLKTNVTDKIPQAGAVGDWIIDDLLPQLKTNIENLVPPEVQHRFLFPSLWKPP